MPATNVPTMRATVTTPIDLHHDHERADELLEAYLLGTLPAADAAWMQVHIARCARCQAELGELLPAAQALPFAAPEPPVTLSDTVWYRIEQAILVEVTNVPAGVSQLGMGLTEWVVRDDNILERNRAGIADEIGESCLVTDLK